jgi:hypothetical protein
MEENLESVSLEVLGWAGSISDYLPPAIDREVRTAITAGRKFIVLVDPAARAVTIGLADVDHFFEAVMQCELD